MIKLLLNLLSFFCFLSLQSQIIQSEFLLSSKNVEDIAHQANGLIWVATDEGLNVFYDDEKHVFYSDIQDSLSLLNSKVNQIKVTSNGVLVALTQDGLNVFDSDKFNFKQIKLDSKPVSIVEDVISKSLWVATANSGYYLINNNFKIKGHYTFDPLNPLSISTSNFSNSDDNSIIVSNESKVFIASENGFNVYDKKLKTFKRYFKGKKSKLSSNNLIANTCLYSNHKLLTWNKLFEFKTHFLSYVVRIVPVNQCR